MTATCQKCEPLLTDDQIDDAKLLHIEDESPDCVGCTIIRIAACLKKDELN